MEEAVQLFTEQTSRDDTCEFVEGLMYSNQEAVIMTGNLTDDVEPDKVRPQRALKPSNASVHHYSHVSCGVGHLTGEH